MERSSSFDKTSFGMIDGFGLPGLSSFASECICSPGCYRLRFASVLHCVRTKPFASRSPSAIERHQQAFAVVRVVCSLGLWLVFIVSWKKEHKEHDEPRRPQRVCIVSALSVAKETSPVNIT